MSANWHNVSKREYECARCLGRDLGLVWRMVIATKKNLREWVRAGLSAKMFRIVANSQTWRAG